MSKTNTKNGGAKVDTKPMQNEKTPPAPPTPPAKVESEIVKVVREAKEKMIAEREQYGETIKETISQLDALDEQFRAAFNEEPPALSLPSLVQSTGRRRNRPRSPDGSGPTVALLYLLDKPELTAPVKDVMEEIKNVTGAQFPNAATAWLKRENLMRQVFEKGRKNGGTYVLTAAGRKEAEKRKAEMAEAAS